LWHLDRNAAVAMASKLLEFAKRHEPATSVTRSCGRSRCGRSWCRHTRTTAREEKRYDPA
jgi:hypothetical protein